MNNTTVDRNRLHIMTELLDLTKEMVEKKEDADFLIKSVDKRQSLMDDFDQIALTDEKSAPEDVEPIKRMAQEILSLDKTIAVTLERHRNQSKSELTVSNSQQKVLGYVNHALSSSGSYMDYKK